jgi:polyisoprenoid-binding protein YceI
MVETYKIDQTHSAITFKIRHIFSQLPGNFSDFEGTIKIDPANPANNSVEAVIQIGSVDTRNEKRDRHLRAEDFFKSEAYPTMTFKSTQWRPQGRERFLVTGDLTIMEITKEVTLDVTLLGSGKRRDKYLTGWLATTTLDRNDFGIIHGAPMIGPDVTVEINIEAVREEG